MPNLIQKYNPDELKEIIAPLDLSDMPADLVQLPDAGILGEILTSVANEWVKSTKLQGVETTEKSLFRAIHNVFLNNKSFELGAGNTDSYLKLMNTSGKVIEAVVNATLSNILLGNSTNQLRLFSTLNAEMLHEVTTTLSRMLLTNAYCTMAVQSTYGNNVYAIAADTYAKLAINNFINQGQNSIEVMTDGTHRFRVNQLGEIICKGLTLDIDSKGLGKVLYSNADGLGRWQTPPNQIQSLSISGNSLTISGSNTVTLPLPTSAIQLPNNVFYVARNFTNDGFYFNTLQGALAAANETTTIIVYPDDQVHYESLGFTLSEGVKLVCIGEVSINKINLERYNDIIGGEFGEITVSREYSNIDCNSIGILNINSGYCTAKARKHITTLNLTSNHNIISTNQMTTANITSGGNGSIDCVELGTINMNSDFADIDLNCKTVTNINSLRQSKLQVRAKTISNLSATGSSYINATADLIQGIVNIENAEIYIKAKLVNAISLGSAGDCLSVFEIDKYQGDRIRLTSQAKAEFNGTKFKFNNYENIEMQGEANLRLKNCTVRVSATSAIHLERYNQLVIDDTAIINEDVSRSSIYAVPNPSTVYVRGNSYANIAANTNVVYTLDALNINTNLINEFDI